MENFVISREQETIFIGLEFQNKGNLNTDVRRNTIYLLYIIDSNVAEHFFNAITMK